MRDLLLVCSTRAAAIGFPLFIGELALWPVLSSLVSLSACLLKGLQSLQRREEEREKEEEKGRERERERESERRERERLTPERQTEYQNILAPTLTSITFITTHKQERGKEVGQVERVRVREREDKATKKFSDFSNFIHLSS